MKQLFLYFSFLILFFSNSAFAAQEGHASYIKNVYPLAGGSVVLVFEETSNACLLDNGNARTYYYLTAGQNGVTEQGFKNIYSAALMAFTSHKKVWIKFDADSSSCHINRLWVYNY